jgi:hypothetical protein
MNYFWITIVSYSKIYYKFEGRLMGRENYSCIKIFGYSIVI